MKIKTWSKESGFTLIELLVVISIIGILSTLAVVSLNDARGKARDAKRISDIKQVQTALELFLADRNGYPTGNDLILGTKRTILDGVIHPIIFQQNGKEVARIDNKGNLDIKGDLKFNGKDSNLFYVRDLYLEEGETAVVKIHGYSFPISIAFVTYSGVRFNFIDKNNNEVTTPLLSEGISYNMLGLEPTVLTVESIDVQDYVGGVKRVAVSFD